MTQARMLVKQAGLTRPASAFSLFLLRVLGCSVMATPRFDVHLVPAPAGDPTKPTRFSPETAQDQRSFTSFNPSPLTWSHA